MLGLKVALILHYKYGGNIRSRTRQNQNITIKESGGRYLKTLTKFPQTPQYPGHIDWKVTTARLNLCRLLCDLIATPEKPPKKLLVF